MTHEPRVRRFRISAIWPAWTSAALERDSSSATLDGANPLWGPVAYRDFVRSLVRATGTPSIPWDIVGLPWDDKAEERFWREYSTQLPDLVGPALVPDNAMKRIVPLHVRGTAPQRTPWKLSFHHFVYPFGIASVLHAEYPHPETELRGEKDVELPLGDVVEACYDLRGDPGAENSWDEWVAGSIGPAAALFGAPDLRPQAPVTVVTFLEVVDVLALDEKRRDSVLNALTGWPERPHWPHVKVARLDVELAPRRAVEGRIVHAARHGRCIWFPDGFVGGKTLSEDHRRFCFSTMQTEMLIRFMVETDRRLNDLPPSWDDWAKRAAPAIGLLHADDQLAAWDSSSPRVQIDKSDALPAINRVRAHYSHPGRLLPALGA